MHPERPVHTAPIGMTISAAGPASPIGSAIEQVNVLSEPHSYSQVSTEYGSPSAATQLQQALDKSASKATSDIMHDTTEFDQPQLHHKSAGSESSLRVATTAAREMVAGLFCRRKKSLNSMSDGSSMHSGSPTSPSSLGGVPPTEDSGEDSSCNLTPGSPTLCNLRGQEYITADAKGTYTSHNKLEPLAVGYTNCPPTSKKIPPTSTRVAPQATIPKTTVNERQYPFAPFTLAQSRFDNRTQSKRVAMADQRSANPVPKLDLQDAFMSRTNSSDIQDPARAAQGISGSSNDRISPIDDLIHKSSFRSISSVDESPATPHREGSIHGSGTAALTNVLASPKFGREGKIDSRSAVGYKLPDNDGYVSFPPFVPSSKFSPASFANYFGRNENSNLLVEDKVREVDPKTGLRRTRQSLVHQKLKASTSTQDTAQSGTHEEEE